MRIFSDEQSRQELPQDEATLDFRRQAVRAPFDPQVTVYFNDAAELEWGGVRNIALGGMFVATATPYEIGQTFGFEFNLAGEVILVRGTAEVVWVRHGDGPASLPPGMGVRFVELDAVSRGIIFRLVDRYIQETGGDPFSLQVPQHSATFMPEGAW